MSQAEDAPTKHEAPPRSALYDDVAAALRGTGELASGADVRPLARQRRSTCVLHRLAVPGPDGARQLLVKQRLPGAVQRAGDDGGRPRIADVVQLSAGDRAALEFAGLQRMFAAGAAASSLAVVRPVVLLPAQASFVMEHVPGDPLRRLLGESARSLAARRRLSSGPFEGAGRALRVLHASSAHASSAHASSAHASSAATAVPPRPRGPRNGAELGHLLREFAHYLGPRAAGVQLVRRIEAVADAATDALPVFPTAVGHNDYLPRNVLLTDDGRPCVIDIFPAWQPAVYEDVCSFLAGLSTVGPRLVTRGAALPRSAVASYEADVLRGYFGSLDAVPVREVLAFQLLMTLDRWSWVATASWSGRAQDVKHLARRRWAGPVFQREVQRLVAQLLLLGAGPVRSLSGTDWVRPTRR